MRSGPGLTKNMFWLAAACLAALQWPLQLALGIPAHNPAWPGLGILGASFLLSWAAEVAEHDIPHGLALGVLALVAVLPEYAVDVYFAWSAGKNPAYAAYATANMTGANRLLIGLGWSSVLFTGWLFHKRRDIRLDPEIGPELLALLAATLYSFVLSLKKTLSLFDCAIFLAIFVYYVARLTGEETEEPELIGPAAVIASLSPAARRAAAALMLAAAAGVIYLAAAPFADGLVEEGRRHGLDEFLLVQWVAPLASEAPEFIVACMLAVKGRAASGLRMLVASKVNQWTLLVGMLPAAYALSAGRPAAMPLDGRQVHEMLLTSAQSLLALAIIFDYRFAWKEAALLGGLFVAQPFLTAPEARTAFAGAYLALAIWIFSAKGTWRNILAASRG